MIGDVSNFNIFREHTEESTSLENIALEECNCVAFRVDNVQDFWLNDVQIELFDLFKENNIDVTAGILGKFFGEYTFEFSRIWVEYRENMSRVCVACG